jgi:hypothetical protein
MAKVAETIVDLVPTKLSNLNDIWNNTIVLSFSQSGNYITQFSNNFRYRTSVSYLDAQDNSIFVGAYEYPSRPKDLSPFGNGYGAFSVSNVLKSFFKLDFNSVYISSPTISVGWSLNFPPAGPLVKYQLDNGFSYNPNLVVEAYESIIAGVGYLSFSFSSINPFDIFSEIYVISDNPYISGNHTIANNPNYNITYSFVTQTPFTASMTTATPDATITNYIQNDSSIQYLYGIDCRLGYKDLYYGIEAHITNGNLQDWKDGVTYKFLNTYPNRTDSAIPGNINDRNAYFSIAKKIQVLDTYPIDDSIVGSLETLTAIIDTNMLADSILNLKYFVSGYSATFSLKQTLQYDLGLSPNTGLKRIDLPVGLSNLWSSFSFSNDISYITCFIATDDLTELVTEHRLFKYDRSCSIYDSKPFLFKNSLGAWDFWTFTQDTKEVKSIVRNEYKQEIPFGNFWSNGGIYYRGQNIYSGKVNENYTANTNWISETEYSYLSEMFESSDVYILEKYDGQYLPYPIPIIITDTNYEIKTSIRDQIFNLTINYKMSFDTPMQAGQ